MKRLAKIEFSLETKKKLAACRHHRNYPGEMVHFDTKRLPLLKGRINTLPRNYLFVGIDDFSWELYAAFFLIRHRALQLLSLCRLSKNALTRLSALILIMARNIKESLVMLLLPFAKQTVFISRKDRELSLARFVNFYNAVKPHTRISNMTPYEKLRNFFFDL